MSSASRRQAMGRVGMGALGAIWALNTHSALAQSLRVVVAPGQPMRLQRQITRELVDGKQLIVRRTWEVRFRPTRGGWLVDGTQIDIDVTAPTGLEALAKLERNRRAEEAFPLDLNRQGQIIHSSASEPQVSAAALAEAARQSLVRIGGSDGDRRNLNGFLAQMQQASASLMTRFPADLFYPTDTELDETKEMDLPGGGTGQMELHYHANADPVSGLLQSSERSVVTRIESEELRSSEAWALS